MYASLSLFLAAICGRALRGRKNSGYTTSTGKKMNAQKWRRKKNANFPAEKLLVSCYICKCKCKCVYVCVNLCHVSRFRSLIVSCFACKTFWIIHLGCFFFVPFVRCTRLLSVIFFFNGKTAARTVYRIIKSLPYIYEKLSLLYACNLYCGFFPMQFICDEKIVLFFSPANSFVWHVVEHAWFIHQNQSDHE